MSHINADFLVERKVLNMSLAVVRYDIGVVTPPGKLIIFPPTVSQVRFVSDFCGCISDTIIP